MPITTPIPVDVLDKYSLSQLLRAIITRAVDGTVVPLFVDHVAGKVLIGTVVSTDDSLLQVNGNATIKGRLNATNIFTTGIASPGNIWAGSLTANGSVQAGSAIIAGPAIISGPLTLTSPLNPRNSLILTSRNGLHTGKLILENPDSNGDMALGIDIIS